jgi:uncharacterized membrane protein YphA (DoxX/SURF4 family)
MENVNSLPDQRNTVPLKGIQQWGFIVLRIVIGWHFLYEGIVKLTWEGWSAESYLINSRGFLSEIFHQIASQPVLLEIVNFINVWGLILIGISLILGFFARIGVYAGILLLFFYYAAYPPIKGYNYGAPQEGHYLLVDKTFIELLVLVLLALFPRTLNIGLMGLLRNMRFLKRLAGFFKIPNAQLSTAESPDSKNRRELLKHLAFVPFLGGFAWAYRANAKSSLPDAISGSTFQLKEHSLNEIEGKMPMGTLFDGKPPISRLIMGTNHLSGTAHARDLVYARSLFRAYNNEKKIMETYMLAEQAGINLFFATHYLMQYKKIFGGNFQTWKNVSPEKDDIYSQVDQAIDMGVDYIFILGARCDRLVHDGQVDVVVKCMDYIKQQGYPAGLGAHTIQAMMETVEAGADPDFYYKTMHHDRYWSAHPMENRKPYLWSSNTSEDHNEFHDNMWCLFPEKTIDFLSNVQKPVVGFKVLAGGAIHPEEGFQYAFDNGADFIEVGMFDFQIAEDVNLAIRSVEKAKNRIRPWYG